MAPTVRKTEWNAHIIDRLEEGCVEVLRTNNVGYKTIVVPGAFEIPFAINQLYRTGKGVADAFNLKYEPSENFIK